LHVLQLIKKTSYSIDYCAGYRLVDTANEHMAVTATPTLGGLGNLHFRSILRSSKATEYLMIPHRSIMLDRRNRRPVQ